MASVTVARWILHFSMVFIMMRPSPKLFSQRDVVDQPCRTDLRRHQDRDGVDPTRKRRERDRVPPLRVFQFRQRLPFDRLPGRRDQGPRVPLALAELRLRPEQAPRQAPGRDPVPVSYTHLTLPTIYSV